MESKKVSYAQYANNIKKNVMKKSEYDKNQIKKSSNNLCMKILDEAKRNGIKNNVFDGRINKLTQNLHENLRSSFTKNTNSLLTNLNDVFSNKKKEEIGSENNDTSLKTEIETVLQDYEQAVKKQVESLLTAYKIPQIKANQIMNDIGNTVHILTDKTILELQDYHKNVNNNFLKFVTSQYEEYEKQISEQVVDNVIEENKEEKISGLKDSVYTDEELVEKFKKEEENKEVPEVNKEKDEKENYI